MLKFNKSTMIGLYAMMELAREPSLPLASAEIGERFEVSRHHLAKVLQQLVRSGLLETTRGASGGQRLARDPKAITLHDIVDVFEGPRRFDRHCLSLDLEPEAGRPKQHCELHGVLAELDDQIAFTLQSISLKTLVSARRRVT